MWHNFKHEWRCIKNTTNSTLLLYFLITLIKLSCLARDTRFTVIKLYLCPFFLSWILFSKNKLTVNISIYYIFLLCYYFEEWEDFQIMIKGSENHAQQHPNNPGPKVSCTYVGGVEGLPRVKFTTHIFLILVLSPLPTFLLLLTWNYL